jgi:hypothetical protein
MNIILLFLNWSSNVIVQEDELLQHKLYYICVIIEPYHIQEHIIRLIT